MRLLMKITSLMCQKVAKFDLETGLKHIQISLPLAPVFQLSFINVFYKHNIFFGVKVFRLSYIKRFSVSTIGIKIF